MAYREGNEFVLPSEYFGTIRVPAIVHEDCMNELKKFASLCQESRCSGYDTHSYIFGTQRNVDGGVFFELLPRISVEGYRLQVKLFFEDKEMVSNLFGFKIKKLSIGIKDAHNYGKPLQKKDRVTAEAKYYFVLTVTY